MPPVTRLDGTLPLAAGTNNDDCSNFDPEALRLDQAAEVDQFRKATRACASDEEKYDLCRDQRDRLLLARNEVHFEIAAYESVMFVECVEYLAYKENTGHPRGDEPEWQEFIVAADDGCRRLAALKTVARCWAVENWAEFTIKANQLLLRYFHVSATSRRFKLPDTVDPLQHTVLENAKKWSHGDSFVMDNKCCSCLAENWRPRIRVCEKNE
ncbi:hypothetical protein O9K51_10896 [Purpureocillium lavendulum]|uniref:Uncharacterized protein n=1 Tax=Purpureocillium lavendulum TaxID=1247861 RepID=A0AB34FDV0_9HYPO|nr:hypothetical protein O9K51_10896 [Purpureocillium lavendulum]